MELRPQSGGEIDRKGSVMRWKNPGYFELVVVVTSLSVVVVRESPLQQVGV